MNKYLTIAIPSQAEIKERGSRFIGIAMPFNHEDQLKDKIQDIQVEYPNATHYCFAYRLLSENGVRERASDDGEPFNSSGPPILRSIESKSLLQILVVVVRYYGGKKLGVSGLKEAYGLAAREALQSANILEVKPSFRLWIRPDNDLEGYKVYELLEKNGMTLIEAPTARGGYFLCSAHEEDRNKLKELSKNAYTFDILFKPPKG
jgi:uncharacterized YigZ family protein